MVDLWFTEAHTEQINFSIKVTRQVYSAKSGFQRIDVYDTPEFGRVLTLDGFLMVTEKDEFIYHDMIVHVPLASNPKIKDVLVIGAGDGGTVRELTRYAGIERIDMVEIDKQVVDVCREYLPFTSCRLDDPRVTIFYEDGVRFVRNRQNEYDLILIDSTDPFGPGEGLFTKEFYGSCHNALKPEGIMVNQHESAFYDSYIADVQRMRKRIGAFFPISKAYQAHIPTYPSGHWLFGFASKGIDPLLDFNPTLWNGLGLETRYYNTELHVGSFALPNYVKRLLGE